MIKKYFKNPSLCQLLVATGPIMICGCMGNAEGYSSILLPQLKNDTDFQYLDKDDFSWIASAYTIPMSFGCIIGGYLMEKIGRRGIHIFTCFPFVIGWLFIALANSNAMLLIGRLLTGLSDGLVGPVTGVFIAETSAPEMRGLLILASSVATTIGIFVVHLLGTYLSWRLTALICAMLALFSTIFMLFFPESPTYLAKKQKNDEAEKSFYWCRGESKQSQTELHKLFEKQKQVLESNNISICEIIYDLKKPELWKPLIIISVLFVTAQCAGNNSINFYCIDILREMKISGSFFNEFYAMLVMDIIKSIAALISCYTIGKIGRRTMVLWGGYGVTISLFIVVASLIIQSIPKFVSLIFLCLYVGILSMSLIPLSWTLMGEVFPQSHRGFGTGFTSFVCYAAIFVVVKTFPDLLRLFGDIVYVFFTYALLTLIGTVYLTIFLPETKDKPLYVIEEEFKNNKK